MFSVTDLIVIALSHWIGDFVLQTTRDAQTKGHDVRALSHHVTTYALAMIPCGLYLLGTRPTAIAWLPATFALHFATDAVTARWTSRFWAACRWKAFFTTVGFDQALHLTAIVGTAAFLRTL